MCPLLRNDPEVTLVSRYESIENRVWKRFSDRRSRYAAKACRIRESGPCEGGLASGRLFTTGTGIPVRTQRDSSVRIRSGGRVGRPTHMLTSLAIRYSSAIRPGCRQYPSFRRLHRLGRVAVRARGGVPDWFNNLFNGPTFNRPKNPPDEGPANGWIEGSRRGA